MNDETTQPGHNPDTERALLASCMAGDAADVHAAVGAGVTAESFADETCATVWRALALSVAAGEGVGVDAVARRMVGLSPVEGGTIRALTLITETQPTSLRRAGLTHDVIDLARRRRLIAATGRAAREAGNPSHSEFADVWEAAEPHLRDAMDVSQSNQARTLAQMCDEALDEITKTDLRPVIHTGLDRWDKAATPPRAGQVIVLAARPGMGKSALAAQIAHHVAVKSARHVAFFSLEMAGSEISKRLAAHRAYPAAPWEHALTAQLAELRKVKTLRIFEVEHSRTLAQIEATCRLMAGNPAGLGAVFIDYLQLITPANTREPREQQVAGMSRAVKLLANTIRAPIFLLAQLNREIEQDAARAPRLSDLRESGAIEQDADRVWFIYPDPGAIPSPGGSIADVILLQAKCRGGPPNLPLKLKFHRPQMTFTAA